MQSFSLQSKVNCKKRRIWTLFHNSIGSLFGCNSFVHDPALNTSWSHEWLKLPQYKFALPQREKETSTFYISLDKTFKSKSCPIKVNVIILLCQILSLIFHFFAFCILIIIINSFETTGHSLTTCIAIGRGVEQEGTGVLLKHYKILFSTM